MKPFRCLVELLPRITMPLSTNGNTIDKRGHSSSFERDSKPRFRCLHSPTPHAPRTGQDCGLPSAVHTTTTPFIVQLSTHHNSPHFKICMGYKCGGISVFNNFNLKIFWPYFNWHLSSTYISFVKWIIVDQQLQLSSRKASHILGFNKIKGKGKLHNRRAQQVTGRNMKYYGRSKYSELGLLMLRYISRATIQLKYARVLPSS